MVSRRETIAGAKVDASSFFVNVCAINFPKSPAWICFATASSSPSPMLHRGGCRLKIQYSAPYLDSMRHYVGMALMLLGFLGAGFSIFVIIAEPNSISEEPNWGEWVVYEGEDDDYWLNGEIGYTIYVDASKYDPCQVGASAVLGGIDHYDPYCDKYYDFENWTQIGDIYPSSGSGYYYVDVDAHWFAIVDWTTPASMAEGEVAEEQEVFEICCIISSLMLFGGARMISSSARDSGSFEYSFQADLEQTGNVPISHFADPATEESPWWEEKAGP